jgi:hypothetical protein
MHYHAERGNEIKESCEPRANSYEDHIRPKLFEARR